MNKKLNQILVAAMALFAVVACTQEEMENPRGKEIQFSARSETLPATKTEYSGVVVNTVERIDWKVGDLIRILCNEASIPASGSSDYEITGLENDGTKYSHAIIDPEGDHGLQWGESGEHTFYAMYPSPDLESIPNDREVSFSLGENYAEVIATLPADQSSNVHTRVNGQDYYGDMDLAYMTAANKATAGAASVSLEFTPIVTTFYVTIKNTTGNQMTLQEVRLTSTHAMNGTFKTTINNVSKQDEHGAPSPNYAEGFMYKQPDGSYNEALKRTDSNSTIYASFKGVQIAETKSISVALFALPKEIENVTLTVTTVETGPISLPMTDTSGEWIEFAGRKKHNLNNIGVPSVSYDITVTNVAGNTVSTVTYDKSGVAGSDQTFYVTSTKTIGNTTFAAPWKAQLRVANTGNDETDWVDMTDQNRPDWMSLFPLNSEDTPEATVGLGMKYQRNVSQQRVISHVDRLKSGKILKSDAPAHVPLYPTAEEAVTYASFYVDNSTAAKAVDLSYYDFTTRRMEDHQYTANTYVISSPGWYKFPCVYGNGIENGAAAEGAYKGHLLRLNHLDRFKKMNDFDIDEMGPWLDYGRRLWLFPVNYHVFTQLVWEKYSVWDSEHNASSTSGANHRSNTTFGTEQVEVITDVRYENDATDIQQAYVIFHVKPETIRPGNALIATKEDTALSSNDKITWSWQIWITDQDMTPIKINNGSEAEYDVLPVNLGWVDDQEGQYYPEMSDVIRFVNVAGDVERCHTGDVQIEQPELEEISKSGWQTYYQWGRKDPFTRDATTSATTDHLLYQSILNPDVMFHEESTYQGTEQYYDWTSANYDNLWDSQCLTYGEPGTQLPNHKTVYDPSPRRYCVPPDNAFNGFASNYETLYDGNTFYGCNFDTGHGGTIYFPASGFTNYESTLCAVVGNKVQGAYWTYHAVANAQNRVSYALHFEGGENPFVHPVDESIPHHRARGYSVRPIVFDEIFVPSVDDGSEEVTFNFSEIWGTTPQSNLSNLNLVNGTDDDIELTFLRGRNTGTGKAMVYEYDSSNAIGSVLLYDSYNDGTTIQHFNGFTISTTNPNKHIVQIELTFIQEGNITISTDKNSYTGGIWIDRDDTPAAVGKDGWSGGESSVTFQTGITGTTPWKLVEIAVYYYTK